MSFLCTDSQPAQVVNGVTDWPSVDPARAWRASLPVGQIPVCGQCATTRILLLATC
jgi:hypothetical protein